VEINEQRADLSCAADHSFNSTRENLRTAGTEGITIIMLGVIKSFSGFRTKIIKITKSVLLHFVVPVQSICPISQEAKLNVKYIMY